MINNTLFHVYKSGTGTLIAFSAFQMTRPDDAQRHVDDLMELLEAHDCQELVVDLSGIGIVSSWILGVLASIKQQGPKVSLYYVSPEIQEVLAVTNLNRLLEVRNGFQATQLAS